MKQDPVYLDYNATAPIRPEVLERTASVMGEAGNASSMHQFGQRARSHVEKAREQIASAVCVSPEQVVFNSGATEGCNAILHGFKDKRVLISAIEHPAVFASALQAEKIRVTRDGVVDLNALEEMLNSGSAPAIVSVMLVNSETGAIQPVRDVAALARKYGALVHTDAVQGLGRIPINFKELGVDFMTLSAHKVAGPMGVGALITRKDLQYPKFMQGGGQERGLRAGTVNVPGIAGFGLAVAIAEQELPDYRRITAMRDAMEARMKEICQESKICAREAPRVGNTTSISVPYMSAQSQLMQLDLSGFAVSSGSACSSGSFKPSHVLMAMGMNEEESKTALRISLGWATTQDEIDRFVEAWGTMVNRNKK